MKGLILAAGRGSRLGIQTADKPKCMTILAGKPILGWILESMHAAGINDIGLVRGYLGDTLPSEGISYFQNARWAETYMVYSLCCASSWLESGTTLVSYSDIVYPKSTIDVLAAAEGDIVISYNTEWLEIWKARFDDPFSDAETFILDEKGLLIEIGKKPTSIDQVHGQYMGLLKITPQGWSKIRNYLDTLGNAKVDKLDCTSLLNGLISAGIHIHTVPVSGQWYEIDNENDLQVCQQLIESGKSWIPIPVK